MGVLVQIALGSSILIACLAIHLVVATKLVVYLRVYKPLTENPTGRTFLKTISAVFLVFLLSHTVHIYVWAASLWILDAMPGYENALYFSLVTYTTLGYGDVLLGPEFRIFGAMASACGILMFGLTTAFTVGFLNRVMQNYFNSDPSA